MLGKPHKRTSDWSNRLEALLKESSNPEADMREAAYMMMESGVLYEDPGQVSPSKFAQLVLEENHQMYDRMRSMPPTDLRGMETAGDLISNLLPSNNGLD